MKVAQNSQVETKLANYEVINLMWGGKKAIEDIKMKRERERYLKTYLWILKDGRNMHISGLE